MKRQIVISALGVALLAVNPLHAFEFSGGDIFVSRLTDDFSGATEHTNIYGGSGELRFGAFGLQADVSNRTFVAGDNLPSWGVHGFYAFSERLKAGLYYGEETWSGLRYSNTGLELAYQRGAWDLEAYFYEDLGLEDDWRSTIGGLNAEFGLNEQFSLHGNLAVSGGDDDIIYYGIGGTWHHRSGAFVRLDAGRFDDRDRGETANVYALRVGFEFGNGVAFSHRNINENLPGYGN
ncbi:MAG: hypothetical protein ACPGUX_07425 [Halocynthiibacter sp.]